MGKVASAIGGGIGSLVGFNQARKESKRSRRDARETRESQGRAEGYAREQADAQKQMLTEQQGAIRAEQARASATLAGTKEKVNAGYLRSNKRRIRGGLFGESDAQKGGTLSPRLG